MACRWSDRKNEIKACSHWSDVVSGGRGQPQSSFYPSGFTGEAQSRHWFSLQVEIPLSRFQKNAQYFSPPNHFSTQNVRIWQETLLWCFLQYVACLCIVYIFVTVQTPQGVRSQHCGNVKYCHNKEPQFVPRICHSLFSHNRIPNSSFTSWKLERLRPRKCFCALKPVKNKVNMCLLSGLNCLERIFHLP